jgi:hypothetical protein
VGRNRPQNRAKLLIPFACLDIGGHRELGSGITFRETQLKVLLASPLCKTLQFMSMICDIAVKIWDQNGPFQGKSLRTFTAANRDRGTMARPPLPHHRTGESRPRVQVPSQPDGDEE